MLRPLVVPSRDEYAEELKRLAVDSTCIEIFLDKQDGLLVKITDLSTPAANILKQTALSVGADVAVHREVITGRIERSDAVFMGTRRQLRKVGSALSGQPFGLGKLDKDVAFLLDNICGNLSSLKLPGGDVSFDEPLVMGVLNVTPDSFSDGGEYLEPKAAIARIDEMLSEGADMIDVGAESTRPGSDLVPPEEQLRRLEPIFSFLEGRRCIWSLDTTNPDVARTGLDRGASIINDVSSGRDSTLWSLAAQYAAGYVLMHMQGTPRTMQQDPYYDDFNAELFAFFSQKLTEIAGSGLNRVRVIIDPGIGFGKRVPDNTAAVRRLGELRAFGQPIMVGASRKSFLGKLLGLDVTERCESSVAVAVLAYANGANILRVHDVKQTKKALRAAAAIRYVEAEES
ncbi:dihydropteroate synthase [candidate division WOR-3 bacterium]|nr:dihydropteroate synthase [candidate division WOR-3 bacterium]